MNNDDTHYYYLEVNGWTKNNGSLKKGHTHFMVSKTIFNDNKITRLNALEFRLYLFLCTLCADFSSSCIAIDARSLPSYFAIRTRMMHVSITSLEENQLVTRLNFDSFKKRIEKNRKERNRIEVESKKKKNSQQQNSNFFDSEKFGPVELFANEKSIAPAMKFVTKSAQEFWISEYKNIDWIKKNLIRAIGYYKCIPDFDEKNWGKVLNNWLSNENQKPGCTDDLFNFDPAGGAK